MQQQGISIVVPVYNGAKTIGACVQSLLKGTNGHTRSEIIIVDNASRDDTIRVLEPYRGRIRILREPERGASAARNTGIRHAAYDRILFTDADCVVDPGWAARMAGPLADPDVGLTGGRILPRAGSNDVQIYGQRIYDHRAAIQQFSPPYAITANWAMNRRVLNHVGYFDTDLLAGHDVDMAWRLLQWGYRLHYQHDAVVYHVNRDTRRKLFMQGLQHGYWGVAVISKHRDFVRTYGATRFEWRRYRGIARGVARIIGRRSRPPETFDVTFKAGKVVGRLSGAARFRYPVL